VSDANTDVRGLSLTRRSRKRIQRRGRLARNWLPRGARRGRGARRWYSSTTGWRGMRSRPSGQ